MSQKKRRIFFDLDFTLYDTHAFMSDLRANMLRQGFPDEAIQAGFDKFNDIGYSFELHLEMMGCRPDLIPVCANELLYHLSHGMKYLLPGVFDGLVGLADHSELHLLTFGFPEFQRAKFSGLQEVAGLFTECHYVWKGESKGDVIARFDDDVENWFVDDSPGHLHDGCAKAPKIKAARMCWPQFQLKYDARDHLWWDVVRSLDEFVELIKRS